MRAQIWEGQRRGRRPRSEGGHYQWLGNTTGTRDDANGFYERSLGTLTNGPATGPAYQLLSAKSPEPRKEGSALPAASSDPPTDRLDTAYDPGGNMTSLVVARGGECIDGVCSHRYGYDWDEVGRLVRARRWDLTAAEAAAAVTAWDRAAEPTPEVELRYTYDAGDQRVVKTAVDEDGDELHTAYVFASLELRRARFDAGAGEGSGEYERTALTEVGYLFANGVRLARLVFEPSHRAVPALAETAEDGGDDYPYGSLLHVFFELGDHLGSTSVVLDQATSELVEATTFLAYGATESDYRPSRWGAFREDYRFTGKEEDSEVGLTYFGKRFLNAQLGRWMSADPLAVHAPGEADLNLYAYVSGRVLQAVDPVGLEGREAAVDLVDLGGGETTVAPTAITPDLYEYPFAHDGNYKDIVFNDFAGNQVYRVLGFTTDPCPRNTPERAVPERAPEPAPPAAAAGTPEAAGLGELGKVLLGAAGEIALGFVPGVGEAMDLATIFDSDATPAERAVAGVSMLVSVLTLGVAPNFGGAFRGVSKGLEAAGAIEDFARAMRQVEKGVEGAQDAASAGMRLGADAGRAVRQGVKVLGRQADTAVAKGWPGHEVLDIPNWVQLHRNHAESLHKVTLADDKKGAFRLRMRCEPAYRTGGPHERSVPADPVPRRILSRPRGLRTDGAPPSLVGGADDDSRATGGVLGA